MSGTRRHRVSQLVGGATVASGLLGAVVGGLASPSSAVGLGTQSAPNRIEAAAAIASSDTIVPTLAPTIAGGPVSEPSGEWVCPVPTAKFTNDWGQPRSGGRRHEGTDMLAPRGTPVFAPVAGLVKRSSSGSGGLMFNLRATDGFTYVGMHLSAYGAEGTVRAGDVIGYVGDTGNARGTDHLHFEIQQGKGKLNPFATLKRYC